jgi:hypothetical protein
MILYTLGHSAHPISHLIHLLELHKVRLVVDVRSTPYSRFHPQYNRPRLEASLGERDIDYTWLGEQLGGRPADPGCYPPDRKVERSQGGHRRPDFSLVMEKSWFREGIEQLLELAQSQTTAILCSEGDPAHCHREVLIAAYLGEVHPQVEVRHILKDGSLVEGGKTVKRKKPGDKEVIESQDWKSRTITPFLNLCPAGAVLVMGEDQAGILAALERAGRELEFGTRGDEEGMGELKAARADEYEKYAGVLLSTSLKGVPPDEWSLLLNRAWNALVTGGGLFLAIQAPEGQVLEEAPDLVRRAGFHLLEEYRAAVVQCLIALKPRLGTNLLDYSVEERAAGQAP